MPQDNAQDVIAIKEWLAKESYLPQDFDDLMVRKFLHSCYGSLERTKKCIERFATARSNMPEVYTGRDPQDPAIQTALTVTSLGTYKAGNNEILVHQLDDPGLEKFNFYYILKSFTIQGDYWLRTFDFFPEGHIIILDVKDYTPKIITKVNIMFFRDFLLYLLEGVPVRVKEVHVTNCPSYFEKLYALVKPILPENIKKIITFHSTNETLHQCIDKKYLPVEYDGEAQSMKEQQKEWIKIIMNNREVFLNDNMWKAELQKKPKNSIESSMSGSFRTLSID